MLKTALNSIIILIFGAILFSWIYPGLAQVPSACEEPIAYSIGTFDRRFGISQNDFLSAIAEAEALWEKPLGKELFTYSPEESGLPVNLVYDYRQETTETLSNLGEALEENEEAYNTLRSEYLRLKTEYENAKDIYDARLANFEERNEQYQDHIDTWNAGRRNSKEQFETLEKEKAVLEKDISDLKSMETKINQMTREVNVLVGQLNRLAKLLNLGAETYNTIGASRGETFTGGVYYSDNGEQGINIYEFSSKDKLVRVLAHELGHALGLEHNDDPKAVMYYLNESDYDKLTQADVESLKKLCGVEIER